MTVEGEMWTGWTGASRIRNTGTGVGFSTVSADRVRPHVVELERGHRGTGAALHVPSGRSPRHAESPGQFPDCPASGGR